MSRLVQWLMIIILIIILVELTALLTFMGAIVWWLSPLLDFPSIPFSS